MTAKEHLVFNLVNFGICKKGYLHSTIRDILSDAPIDKIEAKLKELVFELGETPYGEFPQVIDRYIHSRYNIV